LYKGHILKNEYWSNIIILLPTPRMSAKFNVRLEEEDCLEDIWKQNSEENIWSNSRTSNKEMDFVFCT